jgi:hypothetical protein
VPPYCLSRILQSLEDHSSGASHADAYFYALVAFLANMSFAQMDLTQSWHSRRAYERTRGQLFCALHWKALKGKDTRGKIKEEIPNEEGVKQAQEESSGIGRITNLMRYAFFGFPILALNKPREIH